MKRRRVLSGMAVFGLALFEARGLRAQPSARMPVIGLLDGGERPQWWDAFRQQLRVLGYVEGRNVTFEQRYAKGVPEALPALAKELVQLNVAVIVTSATSAAIAAERETRKIPIVMASGGDLAYGPSYPELFRRAATYVDKILRGANPGDLPIEQATTFELVINANTARALGLAIPPSMLARASRVI